MVLASTGLKAVNAKDKNKENKAKKMLVVYFSRNGMNYWHGDYKNLEKGNTARMAEEIQRLTNADVYEIVSAKPYPFDYRETTDQADKEKRADVRPAIINPLPDLSQYDLIFIGHPIWWSDMPMIVRTFLEQADLTGKKIAHFCTHEGSGLGSSDIDLRNRAKGAEFLQPLAIAGTQLNDSAAEIEAWVKKVTK